MYYNLPNTSFMNNIVKNKDGIDVPPKIGKLHAAQLLHNTLFLLLPSIHKPYQRNYNKLRLINWFKTLLQYWV